MQHTVYDKTGIAVTLESVDAREYVATGNWSYTDPTGKAKAKLAVDAANKLAAEALKAEAEAELAQGESVVAQATIAAEEAVASGHPDDIATTSAALDAAKEALNAIKLKQSGNTAEESADGGLTVKQLREKLTEMNIPFTSATNKADLIKLYQSGGL